MPKGFTLVELIIVVIVISILATLAIPQYIASKERALDKEAQSNLKLIRSAERIYKMEIGYYYPQASSTSDIAVINTNLKLELSASSSWGYSVDGQNASATATRAISGGRSWTNNFASENITCVPGASDPCPA